MHKAIWKSTKSRILKMTLTFFGISNSDIKFGFDLTLISHPDNFYPHALQKCFFLKHFNLKSNLKDLAFKVKNVFFNKRVTTIQIGKFLR